MKISCVVLNYNDADTTMEQVGRICGYPCLDYVVVVDNCSNDDSWARLQTLASDKVIVLSSGNNAGYGAGNNAGVQYSYETLHMSHVIIANPDTEFTEECIAAMAEAFQGHQKVGVVAATMVDGSQGSQASGWKLLPFAWDLLSAGPICRRLFKKKLNYPSSYFTAKRAVYVDAVHGSMLMVDAEKMSGIGGYDERVFLYGEENILAHKMRAAGYKTVLLTDQTYLHQNSASISKTFQSVSKRQKLRHESTLFYYHNYLHINRLQEVAAKVFFGIIMAEIWFCKNVLKLTW